MSDMQPSDATPLPEVRFLKTLVTVLAATMIVGLVTIVGLLVIRLPKEAPLPVLPAQITLPDGAQAAAVTFARSHTVVVTDQGEVLVYRPDGSLAQRVPIN